MRPVAMPAFLLLAVCLSGCGDEHRPETEEAQVPDDIELEVSDPPIYIRQPGGHDFRLFDTERNEVRLSEQQGKICMVTFFYRSCPDQTMCPALLGKINQVARGLPADVRAMTEIFAISFDPQNDTPEALALFAEARELEFTLLTGHPDSIREVARNNFGLEYRAEGPALFAHNMKTFLFDGEGELFETITGSDWKSEDVVARITEHAER
ncbi:MAG: SCO family protein [Planctomycetota bacterium]